MDAMRHVGFLILSGFLSACGSGGGGGGDASAVGAVAISAADLTITQSGVVVKANTGDDVIITATIDCPRMSSGSGRCAKVVGPIELSLDSTVGLAPIAYTLNGVVVDPFAVNFTDVGTLEVRARVHISVLGGTSGDVALKLKNLGHGVAEVVGAPVSVMIAHGPAKLENATSTHFAHVGYGVAGSFDITCPADTAPRGCHIVEVGFRLEPDDGKDFARGTQIDTFVGSVWWWQTEIGHGTSVPAGEVFKQNSPTAVPAGATVTIAVKTAIEHGNLFFTEIGVERAKDGSRIPLFLLGDSHCQSVVGVLSESGCKG